MSTKTMKKKTLAKPKKTMDSSENDPKLKQKLKRFSKEVLKNFKGGKNVPTGFNGF